MRNGLLVIWMTPLLLLTAACAVVAYLPLPEFSPEQIGLFMLCLGPVLAGVNVSAICVQLVHAPRLDRWSAALAAVLLHAAPLAVLSIRLKVPLHSAVAGMLTVPIVFFALLAVIAAMNLRGKWRISRGAPDADAQQPLRFGIGRVLLVTAAVGLCLLLVQLNVRVDYRQDLFSPLPRQAMWRNGAVIVLECGLAALGCLLIGFPTMWTFLGRRLATWRVGAWLLALLVSALFWATVVSALAAIVSGGGAPILELLLYASFPLHATAAASALSIALAARATGFRLRYG